MQASRIELRGLSLQQIWRALYAVILYLVHMVLAGEVLYRSFDEFSGWSLLWCTIAGLALLVNFRFLFGLVFGLVRFLRSKTMAQSRSTAIDRLYREIRGIMESNTEPVPELNREIQARFAELRRLQEAEADEMERRLGSRLHLKPGEGWKAMQRAEDLLDQYEASASQNPSARHSY